MLITSAQVASRIEIGQAIVARALFTGLAAAVADMRQLMQDSRRA